MKKQSTQTTAAVRERLSASECAFTLEKWKLWRTRKQWEDASEPSYSYDSADVRIVVLLEIRDTLRQLLAATRTRPRRRSRRKGTPPTPPTP